MHRDKTWNLLENSGICQISTWLFWPLGGRVQRRCLGSMSKSSLRGAWWLRWWSRRGQRLCPHRSCPVQEIKAQKKYVVVCVSLCALCICGFLTPCHTICEMTRKTLTSVLNERSIQTADTPVEIRLESHFKPPRNVVWIWLQKSDFMCSDLMISVLICQKSDLGWQSEQGPSWIFAPRHEVRSTPVPHFDQRNEFSLRVEHKQVILLSISIYHVF